MDEVLAVGDEIFAHRALEKFSEFERAGKTLVFVSHDLSLVAERCRRAIWLERGRVAADGPAGEVVARYREQRRRRGGGAARRRGREGRPRRIRAARRSSSSVCSTARGGPSRASARAKRRRSSSSSAPPSRSRTSSSASRSRRSPARPSSARTRSSRASGPAASRATRASRSRSRRSTSPPASTPSTPRCTRATARPTTIGATSSGSRSPPTGRRAASGVRAGAGRSPAASAGRNDRFVQVNSPRRMRSSFLPFARPSLGEDEIREVVDTLRSGWITTGSEDRALRRGVPRLRRRALRGAGLLGDGRASTPRCSRSGSARATRSSRRR